MARLELEGLSKHFGPTVAVHEVSLDVRDGEFVVLLGPSGCGKTTTLRMIAGFIAPTAGRVRLGGKDVTALPPWKRNAGMVFQSYALFPHLTVAENVAFGLEMRKVPRAEIAPRVAEALRLVRLDGLRRAPAAPALRRPAAARRAGARARHPARRAAARRAAVEPRRQAARDGAGRDPRAAAQARHHHGDGDARPGGSADHGRPPGRDVRGLGAPGRLAARPLRAPGRPLRGRLRRAAAISCRARSSGRGDSRPKAASPSPASTVRSAPA